MRCYSCDRALNDYESTRKSVTTGEYMDLCNKCIKDVVIATIDREDLEDTGFVSIYEDPSYDELGVFVEHTGQHNGWQQEDEQ